MDEKITLTDEEWMSIIDVTRDGLPICCANISALRDEIIEVAREGGDAFFGKSNIEEKVMWVKDDHTLSPVILKICEQLGIDLSTSFPHKAEGENTCYISA